MALSAYLHKDHRHRYRRRFSWADIRTVFTHDFVEASVVIGHDGSARTIRGIDHRVNIEKLYKALYNNIKRII